MTILLRLSAIGLCLGWVILLRAAFDRGSWPGVLFVAMAWAPTAAIAMGLLVLREREKS